MYNLRTSVRLIVSLHILQMNVEALKEKFKLSGSYKIELWHFNVLILL